ncbi:MULTISPECIES: pyrroline-5-carboxylate reductase [Amycolatopsis]|uniref:Pyrroline-5-carboxylate reductase n=1 Tax=Amycolatopsis echigonensis TaxID=2576905 RepID=A0A8E1VUD2_9PSEU|nr:MULTISPECIES: pyrroline-5-carboxylate reductase [Amycolatopsis]MBB2498455.1 pyrroline-5-carboxylate reductase [Amycolatopsis echigonensis]
MVRDRKIALLGVGQLGEALLAGLLAAGRRPQDLTAVVRSPDRAAELTERYGVRVADAARAAASAQIVVIAVKPPDVAEILQTIGGELKPDATVVSLCAGVPTAWLEAQLPAGAAVVRAMPNTPMAIGEAISAISPGRYAADARLAEVECLLAPVGKVVRVAEEQQDAVTALSGSGPAYFHYLVEAMIDAGVLLGLPRAASRQLAVQSMLGSAELLRARRDHPALARDQVTSPGGATTRAVQELDRHRVRASFMAAIEAASDRSRTLGSRYAVPGPDA